MVVCDYFLVNAELLPAAPDYVSPMWCHEHAADQIGIINGRETLYLFGSFMNSTLKNSMLTVMYISSVVQAYMLATLKGTLQLILWLVISECEASMCCTQWAGMPLGYQPNSMPSRLLHNLEFLVLAIRSKCLATITLILRRAQVMYSVAKIIIVS